MRLNKWIFGKKVGFLRPNTGFLRQNLRNLVLWPPTHSVFWRLPWVIFGWITCRYLTNVVNQSLDKSFCLPRDKWLCQSGSKRDIRSVARSFDMETNKSAAFLQTDTSAIDKKEISWVALMYSVQLYTFNKRKRQNDIDQLPLSRHSFSGKGWPFLRGPSFSRFVDDLDKICPWLSAGRGPGFIYAHTFGQGGQNSKPRGDDDEDESVDRDINNSKSPS